MSSFSPSIRDFIATADEARRLGPYLCKQILDDAGTAPVFKAVEEHAGHAIRDVAVKVFDIGRMKGGADAEGWQARVVDEARSLCRVQHPNVIRFHTLVTDAKRSLMGLVMEFADGISGDRELAALPAADERRIALAIDIGISAASALAAAHEAGVVHCNVKPSNIVLTDGTHKLINFGLAASLGPAGDQAESAPRVPIANVAAESIGKKASTLASSTEDSDAAILGTIGYVDPVCVKTTAAPIASSDLYSLGVTLYECIAGDVPSVVTAKESGKKDVDTQVLVGDVPATPLAEVASYVPADLATLIDSLLAAKREGRPRSADAVRRTLERIRSALAGRARELPPEERGPFPGLDRYELSDRDVFFGRSAEIAGVLELCRTRGLVGIVGLSGSGKSSITRAGLVPSIEEGALGGWPAKYRSVLVTPGTNLMKTLEAALSKAIDSPLAKHPEAMAQQLSADVDATGEGIVILIDQLEELVLKHDKGHDRDRLQALDLLTRLAEAPVGVRVMVAIRGDFLDPVLEIDARFARALSRGIQHLGPLGRGGWEEVLDQSLAAYDFRFESADVRTKVLRDLESRETAMTLAQFGLTRLWAARDTKKKTIPDSAFSAKEGMRGALEAHAEAAISKLSIPREKLRDVLLAMTTPEGTRAHVKLDSFVERFGADAKEAVLALAKARIVASEAPGFTFVHDSILKDWSLVRRWIEDARDDRLLLHHVERDAARWAQTKDPAELWRKSRLAAALDLWKREGSSLSGDARAFLNKSSSEEAKMRVAFWFLVSLVVLLVVGGSLIYAKESRERAEQAQRDANALSAALAEVKRLKQEAEENGMEAAASAKLLADLQKQMADERATYGAQVQATLKKITSATSLDGAQKATEDLKSQNGPSHNQVVPLPLDLSAMAGGGAPKLDPSGPAPSGGAGTFDQSAIERVVNTRKAGVKRTCLERSGNNASSVKVTASITIAPNGTVQSVSSSGDPVVGKCIEQQLRSWSFPPPGEVKQVQIPFVFVRQ